MKALSISTLFLSAIFTVGFVDASAPFASIAITKATLLSGGLTSCVPSPNVSTCTGGISSARFILRNTTQALGSQNTEMISLLDKDSPFVLMHPSDLTVNIEALRRFGMHYYFCDPSIVHDRARRSYEQFYNDDVQMLQSNTYVSISDEWFEMIRRQAILFNGTIGLAVAAYSGLANTTAAYESLPAIVRYLRQRVKVVVAVNADPSIKGPALLAKLESDAPDILFDLQSGVNQPCRPVAAGGGTTILCQVASSSSTVDMLHIYLNENGTALASAEANSASILGLWNKELDRQYYDDQDYFKAEAIKASAFDPIIGTANTAMPAAGVYGVSNRCFQGECGQGTLNGRALLYNNPDADVAISGAGGYRGGGWAAGNIRTSHLWEMMPFANSLASCRILGYKFWELMNTSLWFYSGSSDYDVIADRFLQGEGYQVDFDVTKPRFTNRLLAIRIRNRETGVFEPLERTKYYTLATDSYTYSLMPESSPILQRLYEGESVVYPFGSTLRQVALAEYLTKHSPYDDLFSNSLTPITPEAGRTAMDWRQTAESCGPRAYWNSGIVTCITCADGQEVNLERNGCQISASGRDQTVIIIAVVVVACALIFIATGLLLFLEHRRRKTARNVDAAPPSSDRVTFVFTDIQSSTKLWGTVPASMAAALETHHRVIRRCITEFGGYEVKTIGDSFMIACKDVEKAALMAVAIEEQLWVEQWPSSINAVYACEGLADELDRLDEIDDAPQDITPFEENSTNHNGVRVRIGMNCGPAEAVFDEVSRGFDYYGPAVNLAARIEGASQGGQVLTSKITANMLPISISTEFFAEVQLQGITGPTELFQIRCPKLPHLFNPANSKAAAYIANDEQHSDSAPTTDDFERKSIRSSKSAGTASVQGQQLAILPSICKMTLITTLKLLKPSERNGIITTLAKAWRVQNGTNVAAPASFDETIVGITQRVLPALRRKLRGERRRSKGSSTPQDQTGLTSNQDVLGNVVLNLSHELKSN